MHSPPRSRLRGLRRAWLIAAALAASACGEDDKAASSVPPGGGAGAPAGQAGAGDAKKGQQVWMANCVACHNPDPARDGTLGPAVRGASRELLDARVVRGTYPPGYAPKRNTKVMPPRPDLAAAIGDLAAYLR